MKLSKSNCRKCGGLKGSAKGYIVLPCFKVKVCKNCDEVEAIWSDTVDIFFRYIFQFFWTGKVHITEE